MKERARFLRKNMPDAENRMWYYLRARRLNGFKFVRQLPFGKYIVDFACREKALIIEIDGGQHLTARSYDETRTKYLESCGYRVFRVWNNEVFSNINGVLENILQLLDSASYLQEQKSGEIDTE